MQRALQPPGSPQPGPVRTIALDKDGANDGAAGSPPRAPGKRTKAKRLCGACISELNAPSPAEAYSFSQSAFFPVVNSLFLKLVHDFNYR